MPSLQSLQIHQQQQLQQQQQEEKRSEMQWESSLPSPDELQGEMIQDSTTTWPPPPPPPSTRLSSSSLGNPNTDNSKSSFLNRMFNCVSVESLRPYFDVDTADIVVRIKGSIKYCTMPDGFRNEVLYSNNAVRLEYGNVGDAATPPGAVGDNGSNVEGGENTSTVGGDNPSSVMNPATSVGKGPDLYGPIWITMTLVFFVAVTSNISIYVHHSSSSSKHALSDVVSESPVEAEDEWDYDINHLLRATSILYSFSLLLPFLLYLVFRVLGITSLPLVELICLYGYSLVPYLPSTWICIAPYGWIQWLSLLISTIISGMLVLRNVTGPILECASVGGNGKSGGLIMSLLGCHFVFFLVMKLAFYHHG